MLDELGLTFADGRASIETDIPVENYNLKKGTAKICRRTAAGISRTGGTPAIG